ncbi:MAG TPA: iron-sulfur cluster repair protein YtfE [Kofleriaceae bacterium]|nr:iron-sulfur cluster repair protein YtfE [Kofleriaceae bacterium]
MQSTTTSLRDFARLLPASTRVFLRHHLDFCCGGKQTLAEACAKAALDPNAVLAEIESEISRGASSERRWDNRSQVELADHIEQHYHAALRRNLPSLIEAARKVERVHAAKESVPKGLADVLERFANDMEAHMQKEERVLFPMLRRGARGPMVAMPVSVMESEHDSHAEELAEIRRLTDNLTLPAEACATWRALYNGLENLEAELMQHIHLENNILFARATASA